MSGVDGEVAMATVQISARVDVALKKALDRYCRSRGIVMNHFIEEALLDRLEELEDAEDLKKIRHEPTRPLSEVLAELKLDEKL
jgi:serine/threonine protein kinase HipA of HipAB toxin-antitoxin module